jgi:hypothetical protein
MSLSSTHLLRVLTRPEIRVASGRVKDGLEIFVAAEDDPAKQD